jgi:hypothetical protein
LVLLIPLSFSISISCLILLLDLDLCGLFLSVSLLFESYGYDLLKLHLFYFYFYVLELELELDVWDVVLIFYARESFMSEFGWRESLVVSLLLNKSDVTCAGWSESVLDIWVDGLTETFAFDSWSLFNSTSLTSIPVDSLFWLSKLKL